MTSGRVRTRFSLQPSREGPPKSAAESLRRWIIVPMAPSRQTILSANKDFRFVPRFVMSNQAWTVYRSPFTVCRKPRTVYRLPFAVCRSLRVLRNSPRRNQDLEGIIPRPVAVADVDALETRVAKEFPQLRGGEAQVDVAQPRAHPRLVVAAEVE